MRNIGTFEGLHYSRRRTAPLPRPAPLRDICALVVALGTVALAIFL